MVGRSGPLNRKVAIKSRTHRRSQTHSERNAPAYSRVQHAGAHHATSLTSPRLCTHNCPSAPRANVVYCEATYVLPCLEERRCSRTFDCRATRPAPLATALTPSYVAPIGPATAASPASLTYLPTDFAGGKPGCLAASLRGHRIPPENKTKHNSAHDDNLLGFFRSS